MVLYVFVTMAFSQLSLRGGKSIMFLQKREKCQQISQSCADLGGNCGGTSAHNCLTIRHLQVVVCMCIFRVSWEASTCCCWLKTHCVNYFQGFPFYLIEKDSFKSTFYYQIWQIYYPDIEQIPSGCNTHLNLVAAKTMSNHSNSEFTKL